MSNTCHSTLKVYGNKVHADTARNVVKAVFGSCVPDEENQFLRTESPAPLAVVRISSTDVPPAMLVEELSAKLPGLIFELIYAIPLGDLRGHVKFVARTATYEYAERYLIEEEPRVESNSTVAGNPGHVVSLTTIKEIAKQRFDQAYSCIHEEISADYDIPWKEKMTMNLQVEEYELLKSLLGLEGEEDFKRMEQHYKARAQRLAARVKAHDLFRQALMRFETPEIAALLDADDHGALTRVAKVLPKVMPDFRKELATAVE